MTTLDDASPPPSLGAPSPGAPPPDAPALHDTEAVVGTTTEEEATETDRLFDAAASLLAATWSTADPVLIATSAADELLVAWANRALSEVVKIDADELIGTPLAALVSGPHGEVPLNARRSTTFAATVTGRDGLSTSWELHAQPAGGETDRSWTVTFRPPVHDKSLDELLRASEERFRALAERAPIGIFSSEVGLRWGYVNDQLAEFVGSSSESLLGTGWMSFVHPADLDTVVNALQSTLAGEPGECGLRFVTTTAEERWVNLRVVPVRTPGAPAAFLGTLEDVTERRRFEDLLSWQATHDPLTSLPNRALLADELAMALAEPDGAVALLFFDLDDFKEVNDTLGHRAGDKLLITVADRMRTAVRGHDSVFRFAGDEFVILARGVADDHEALGVAERLRDAVAKPVDIDGVEVAVQCSVGVVRADEDVSADELVRDADVAMYAAKRSGKGKVAVFDHAVRMERERQHRTVERLREAVATASLVVRDREITSQDGTLVGYDAGFELDDPESGLIGDTECRAMAESAGFATELGTLLLTRACEAIAARRAGGSSLWTSVPVSPVELLGDGFTDRLARTVVSKGLTAGDLWLHVSADAAVEDHDRVTSILTEIRGLGIRVALDRIGAGRSSLRLLAQLPADAFRIPVEDLAALGDQGEVVVSVAAELARSRGLPTIAVRDGSSDGSLHLRCDLSTGNWTPGAASGDDSAEVATC